MSRPFKGVIVPLESFIESVRASNKTSNVLEFLLIKKLLEDQFLLDVRPRHRQDVFDTNVLNHYIGELRNSVPDYEILFSKCFHDLKMRMWYFPDVVYIEQLGDSLIVTWKRE